MTAGSLDRFAQRKLESLARRSLHRELAVTARRDAGTVDRDGTRLISFACNDYLGLSHDPDVIEASRAATWRYGVGAGASRLITGNHPLYAELERRLAEIKGTEDAVIFGSGYLTNIGVIPLFAGAADLVLVDELCHSCILSGASLSRSRVLTFKHNGIDDARALLDLHRDRYRHCLIVTDGVFSMEGDLAPLVPLAALAREYDAWLMTDDAHGLGVVGGGRGSTFAHAEPVDVPLQMGTLSKAVGGYGGYLCASGPVADLVRNRARSFVYSTGLPPGCVAAAIKSLEIISGDPELVARPLARARSFTQALALPPAQSAIVAIVLGSAERAMAASERLREAGYLVPAIRPPTVPNGTARLRFAFSAAHSQNDVAKLAAAVTAAGIVP
jgi:8-amino-7-oxononanoate synthase